MKRRSIALTAFIAVALGGVLVTSRPAAADDPLNTIRNFCQLDGLGARLQARTWPSIAPLVSWTLEPAWDRLLLISGYEVGTPHLKDSAVEIEVQYSVTGELHPGKVERHPPRIESRTFRLALDETTDIWRIAPPPPPPYLFEAQVDADTLAAALKADQGTYLSSSAFVWRLLQQSGWELPYDDAAALMSSHALRDLDTGNEGDLVLWLDDDSPYQVGLLESPGIAVTSTLNGGVRRVPLASFAGEVRYRRFLPPHATPTPGAPTAAVVAATASPARR
jgi:hypothetical protein